MEQIQSEFNYRKFLIFSLVPMALLLNQANVIFGVNTSLSDFFLFTTILFFPLKKDIRLPITVILFILVLTGSVIFTSFFWDTIHFHFYADPNAVLRGYMKIVAVFLYFTVGYNLARLGLISNILKWFSIGAVCLGCLSLLATFITIPFLQDIVFYGGNRFRGLMNDPNFFAVVQSTALMYFWENKSMKLKAKFINCLILILSLFASGSKTAMVLLVLIFIFKGISVVFSKNLNKQKLTLITLFVLIFAVLFFFFVTYFTVLLDELSQIIPSFQRVTELFTNFEGAISDSGSTRDLAWGNASQLIKFSPFIGIGIGTYSDLAMFLFGNSTIAHNTYLQLAAEWGMILTVIFIGYLFYHMIAASYHSKGKNTNSKLLRDMLIPFLIGSLSLSLNNARLFWLLFGALVFFTSLKSRNFDNSLE